MDFKVFLDRHHDAIIREWKRRLRSDVSPRYSNRPAHEYDQTINAAFDAYYCALVFDDYSRIDDVVQEIGKFRFQGGFTLSEVQKAFEMFGYLVIPRIVKDMAGSVLEIIAAIDRVQVCLNYTIHLFSDFFQALSEKEIRNYAQMLEIKVRDRTRELVESEAKYRTLVEEIRDGYFVNQDGKIVFSNKAFSDMHGYTVDEVIGRPYTDFVAPESLTEVMKTYKSRIENRKSREHYVYFRLHKDGRSLATENRVAMTVYDGKKAALGICRDITERLEIEKRIREAENLAHIGEITTSLAHEIRNPLSAARMSIQMLLKSDSFKGHEKRRLEILAQEVGRLNKIVSEMLDFAKPMKFDLKSGSLTDLITSCLDAIDTRMLEKGIVVTTKFPGKVPLVNMDREKMEQAVINLLLNAVEAVEDQGTIDIVVKNTREPRAGAAVLITDNGHGIDPGSMPYIFDPFFTRKTKGTGLGLANTKKIIEAHGGKIELVPAEPSGTRAIFTIPAIKGA
ncbi:MAG: PAS domain S-box protein [Deltaproteobacteria bacterium]|nr:PAS domain S-box protein [Deltaproteobacteria bacterium]